MEGRLTRFVLREHKLLESHYCVFVVTFCSHVRPAAAGLNRSIINGPLNIVTFNHHPYCVCLPVFMCGTSNLAMYLPHS